MIYEKSLWWAFVFVLTINGFNILTHFKQIEKVMLKNLSWSSILTDDAPWHGVILILSEGLCLWPTTIVIKKILQANVLWKKLPTYCEQVCWSRTCPFLAKSISKWKIVVKKSEVFAREKGKDRKTREIWIFCVLHGPPSL